MAWGPDGPTHRVDRVVELQELLDEVARKPNWQALRDFIACHKEGDEVRYESESNRNRGFSRYVGKRPNSITYILLISSRMS